VERLEDRTVPSAMISVSDASAVEGSGTMKFIDAFVRPGSGTLLEPRGIDYGPDGNLYVNHTSWDPPQVGWVERYNGVTGDFMDVFASEPTLTGAKDVEFGPDGNLYVANNAGNNIYRFNGTTGAFMDVFVTGWGATQETFRSLIFGPDGNGDGYRDLYVTSASTNNVLRYDGVSGAFIDAFVPAGSGGLTAPTALVFGPDGNLYVASGAHTNYYNSILRYNGSTGAFMDVFVPAGSAGLTLAPTAGVIFGPDVNGDATADLYVSNGEVDEVLIYSGTNGSFLQKYIPPGLGGLDNPKGLLFDHDGNLLVVNNGDYSVKRFGASSQAVFTVSLNEPSATPVTVDFSTANGTAAANSNYTAVSGSLTFAPGATTRTVLVRTINNTLVQGNTTFFLNLANPVGATIARGQGVATITDNDVPKFFVVDDASTDRTYRYGGPGNALTNSVLTSGNTAPRGAASTVAGDKVWVVDANKKVYVYNTVGGLLGSWTAGGLNAQAQLEGIATNGTDVWLLDNKLDKVYKYVGGIGAGANRISGTQNAASSFSLNRDNSNGKGMVTDGTSLWVVNDGSSDKVFKYALTGTLLGSWTIDPANAAPTGLTINPASVSDIWVVDSGTDRVYQYTSAAGRTSGSQNAAATFVLAAGNTNPQDIADPPAPGTLFSAVTAFPDANLPASTSFAATSQRETPTSAAIRAPAMQDRIWALAGGELLDWSSRLFLNNPARESFATDPDRAWTSIRLPGGTSPREPLALRSPIGNDAAGPDPDVADLVAGVVAEERQPFEGRDALFALLADDPLHKKAPSPWLST
jgi:hypothetical protein